MEEDRFPDFPYHPSDVVKFIRAGELFSCLLRNGHVIHFIPYDTNSFRAWLVDNGVEDVRIGENP